MKVLKFGGSSVKNAEAISNVLAIVKDNFNKNITQWIVVSALGGVTDEIIACANKALRREDGYHACLDTLLRRHVDIMNELTLTDTNCRSNVTAMFDELKAVCDGIFALGELSPKVQDRVMSFGEQFSACILTSACQHRGMDAVLCDTRDFVVTDETFGSAIVDFEATGNRMKSLCIKESRLRISPGFIARSHQGRATTLGRDGSDYTASIIGSLTGASVVELWTDVDGVMTANPNIVSGAISIDAMTYEEAMELSHFGARVIHPPTMHPVMKNKIPLVVRNTFNAPFTGTVIGNTTSTSTRTITGITTISPITLMTISGGGMIGVKGLAGRLFTTLGQNEINLILITQASSEHSICFAILPDHAERAQLALEKEFAVEITNNSLNAPSFEQNMCIVAVVGERMRQKPGIAGSLFAALGQNGINVAAIAQGSSELNISIVIHNSDHNKALNKIHTEFF